MPANFTISSLHLVFVVPDFENLHYVVIFVHLLSLVLARCPTHLHFLIFTCFMISWILVCSLIHSLVFLSLLVIPSIHLSTLLCVVLRFCSFFCHCPSLCTICHRCHMSYVIDGNTHWSKTVRFRHIGMLLFIMSFNFPKALHPAWVLLLISSKWL